MRGGSFRECLLMVQPDLWGRSKLQAGRQTSPFDSSEILLAHLNFYRIASHEHGIHFTRSMQADKSVSLLGHRHALE